MFFSILTGVLLIVFLLIVFLLAKRKKSITPDAVPTAPHKKINDWFFVIFDEKSITIKFNHPEHDDGWEQSFDWCSITRVCYKREDYGVSDGIYVFTSNRPESYVVPVDGNGGAKFLMELGKRNLFPYKLIINASTDTDTELICWPSD